MLVTFSCKAYENITMLNDVAKTLLTLMGHSGVVPGAIVAEDISQDLSKLELGIKSEGQNASGFSDKDDEEEVNLATRAFPLINMLKAAMKQHCNVMWQ